MVDPPGLHLSGTARSNPQAITLPYAGNLASAPATAGDAAFSITHSDGVSLQGVSTANWGVNGESTSAAGVHGASSGFDAVVGETSSDAHAGVTGRNFTKGASGGVGIYGVGGLHAAKFDGHLQTNGGATITGPLDVASVSTTGEATIKGQLTAGSVISTGSATINGNLQLDGTLSVETDIILTAQDCAEDFEIRSGSDASPGTVMVVENGGGLSECSVPYDARVAGVVSGAYPYRPGMILGRSPGSTGRTPVALAGRVSCKVDARLAPIACGDLLTTSSTPGHAMKATDRDRAFGAVIGKALEGFDGGLGTVAILVGLQ